MDNIKRPDGAKTKLDVAKMLRCAYGECGIIKFTAPAATAAIPQISAVVQEFVEDDSAQRTIVCSGTSLKVQDTVGVLAYDAAASATSQAYITSAPRILMPLKAGDTPAVGQTLYRVNATGLISVTSTSATKCGYALATLETNPTGLPAGDYVEMCFMNY
jgi:isoaspartyl peptidase/L-asparaginase-like protein (Ntn-hydrolase superfamily)